MSSTAIIIQARTGSTRLPRKVLRKFPDGRTVLDWTIDRCLRVKGADQVIVATSNLSQDDVIENFCNEKGILVFRGSESDVLERFIQCLTCYPAEFIVRITSDCPFIDPKIVDAVIELAKTKKCDYASNTRKRTFPRGLDCEVIRNKALLKAHNEARSDYERTHVTPYLYEHPEFFTMADYCALENLSHLRLTVDTETDFNMLAILTQHLPGSGFQYGDIEKLYNEKPNLFEANREINQKEIHEC